LLACFGLDDAEEILVSDLPDIFVESGLCLATIVAMKTPLSQRQQRTSHAMEVTSGHFRSHYAAE
jgi:23S rRNA C2498 (ribose-2'-O)-methylase RlmM